MTYAGAQSISRRYQPQAAGLPCASSLGHKPPRNLDPHTTTLDLRRCCRVYRGYSQVTSTSTSTSTHSRLTSSSRPTPPRVVTVPYQTTHIMETSYCRLRAITQMPQHTRRRTLTLQTMRPKPASGDERTRRALRYVVRESGRLICCDRVHMLASVSLQNGLY